MVGHRDHAHHHHPPAGWLLTIPPWLGLLVPVPRVCSLKAEQGSLKPEVMGSTPIRRTEHERGGSPTSETVATSYSPIVSVAEATGGNNGRIRSA